MQARPMLAAQRRADTAALRRRVDASAVSLLRPFRSSPHTAAGLCAPEVVGIFRTEVCDVTARPREQETGKALHQCHSSNVLRSHLPDHSQQWWSSDWGHSSGPNKGFPDRDGLFLAGNQQGPVLLPGRGHQLGLRSGKTPILEASQGRTPAATTAQGAFGSPSCGGSSGREAAAAVFGIRQANAA